ncbi:helix-turn-helix domain-containing protein [Agromyces humatus]|uniref:Helix-turn-helix domain-containing protein n=1 Tax=Agromyces humatus TaxID=279573 RepID=A0ABN2K825_9MICO|nr:helix-turn-helix domain-containing protein [Agromyces humatus]
MSLGSPAVSAPQRTPHAAEITDFSRFRTAVSESFVPLHVTSDRPDPFRGSISHAAVDGVHFSIVSATEHTVERTPRLIADTERRYFKLGIQLEGTGLLVQDDRETLMQPGSLALYDTDRPYSLAFDGAVRCLVVMFPTHMIDLPLGAVAQLTATPLARSGGVGPVVAPFLENLAAHLDQVSGTGGGRLARNTIDLVVTMLANELDLARIETAPRQRRFAEITRYIDEHLSAADLVPGTIAAAHFISPRHLHAIFHENDTTVSTWIRRRRLEQCKRQLEDARFDDWSVMRIAGEWGFTDPAHFSRAFKAEFGCSPRHARNGR